MQLLNLLTAVAFLLWGAQLLHAALARAFAPRLAAWAPAAARNPYAAAGIGVVAGLLGPASSGRDGVAARAAADGQLALAPAAVVQLGWHVGAALAALLFLLQPPWTLHALAIVGALLALAGRGARSRSAGAGLFGAGLVLLGLRLATAASSPLEQSEVAAALVAALQDDALLAVVVGAAAAACLRSMFAAVLLIAAVASGAAFPAALALTLLIGASLGVAALGLAGSGAAPGERRLAAVRLLLSLAAGGVALVLLHDLSALLELFGGPSPVLLAAANVTFQAMVAAVGLPLAGALARAVGRWIPEPAPERLGQGLNQLDDSVLQTPSVALSCVMREVVRLADLVEMMLRDLKEVFLRDDPAALRVARQTEDAVDALYHEVKQCLMRIAREPLTRDERRRWEEMMAFTISLEQLADGIERMLQDLERQKMNQPWRYPAAASAEVCALHAMVRGNLRTAVNLCLERSPRLAESLVAAAAAFEEVEKAYAATHLVRLVEADAAAAAVSSLHIDLLDDLGRMNAQACALGRTFLDLRASAGSASAALPRLPAPASHVPVHAPPLP